MTIWKEDHCHIMTIVVFSKLVDLDLDDPPASSSSVSWLTQN